MSHPISGNPASFPAEFVVPDDGEARTAASVNVPFEALADRTAYLKDRINAINSQASEVTGSGNVVVPSNAHVFALVEAFGGGGGGGGGRIAPSADVFQSGGGGGGGALMRVGLIPVVPGETLVVTIGAGGAGGSNAPNHGDPGGDTIVTRNSDSAELFRAKGAAGGRRADAAGVGGTDTWIWSVGGNPVAGNGFQSNAATFSSNTATVWHTSGGDPAPPPDHYNMPQPGHGGPGRSASVADTTVGKGKASPEGYAGGAAGTPGAGSGSFRGGGAGGGGGAGPRGGGGAGGDGGNANSSGTGGAGSNGASASANTGAGGGGAGSAAGGGSPSGGTGGTGGSGWCRITFFLASA